MDESSPQILRGTHSFHLSHRFCSGDPPDGAHPSNGSPSKQSWRLAIDPGPSWSFYFSGMQNVQPLSLPQKGCYGPDWSWLVNEATQIRKDELEEERPLPAGRFTLRLWPRWNSHVTLSPKFSPVKWKFWALLSRRFSSSCYSECGPQASSIRITWELVRNEELRPLQRLTEQQSGF